MSDLDYGTPQRVASSRHMMTASHAGPGELAHADGRLIVVGRGAFLRCRMLSDGRRQVTAVYTAGDPVNVREVMGAAEPGAAHFIALDGTEYARSEVGKLSSLDRYLALEVAVTEQMIIGLGQRHAAERVANFFCQLAWKLRDGPEVPTVLPLRFTQELLGSVVGISTVHVNRIVQQFRRERLANLTREGIVLYDYRRLVHLAEFDPIYLDL